MCSVYGNRQICSRNQGASGYLGKSSLLTNVWHLSVLTVKRFGLLQPCFDHLSYIPVVCVTQSLSTILMKV